jgi:hypothetical protein
VTAPREYRCPGCGDLLNDKMEHTTHGGAVCLSADVRLAARVRELEAENKRLRLEMQAACTSLCPHGLDVAAQKENAERLLREYEHHVMTGRSEQHDRLVAENERLRGALKQFAECDLNDSNCSGLPVAVARIRNIARAALAGEKP